MKLEALLLFAIIFAALIVGAELASESSDCRDRGGVMVKTAIGGVNCVKGAK